MFKCWLPSLVHPNGIAGRNVFLRVFLGKGKCSVFYSGPLCMCVCSCVRVSCVHLLVVQSLSHMAFCAPRRIRAVISASGAIWGGIITSHLVFQTDTRASCPSLAHSLSISLYHSLPVSPSVSLSAALALHGSISGSTQAATQLTRRNILFVVCEVVCCSESLLTLKTH